MGKYIKLFENHTQYTAYTASTIPHIILVILSSRKWMK